MQKIFKPKKLLSFIILTGLFAIFLNIQTNIATAGTFTVNANSGTFNSFVNFKTCLTYEEIGVVDLDQLPQDSQDQCRRFASELRFTVYEVYMCETEPVEPTQSSAYDVSGCFLLFTNPDGATINLIDGEGANPEGTVNPLPAGAFKYSVIVMNQQTAVRSAFQVKTGENTNYNAKFFADYNSSSSALTANKTYYCHTVLGTFNNHTAGTTTPNLSCSLTATDGDDAGGYFSTMNMTGYDNAATVAETDGGITAVNITGDKMAYYLVNNTTNFTCVPGSDGCSDAKHFIINEFATPVGSTGLTPQGMDVAFSTTYGAVLDVKTFDSGTSYNLGVRQGPFAMQFTLSY